jgi:Rieske Fe-S protein
MSSNDPINVEAPCGQGCPCGAFDSTPRPIARREFVVGAAAALAAMALAACGGDHLTAPETIASTQVKVSDFPALATVGGVATTSISGSPVAIVRTGSTTFAAFSRICPHQGATIDVVNSGFRCPKHGATFSLSGQWTGGQKTSNLKSYPVAYDGTTGTLTIGG